MIFTEKIAERNKRDRIGYAGALLLFVVAVFVPADILTKVYLLRPLVEKLTSYFPMIDAFAIVSSTPESTRLVLSTLFIVTPLFTVPIIHFQAQLQDFARTNPRVLHFGWGMVIFLACPWWLRPGAGTGHRAQFLNSLVSVGPIGLGLFTVGLYTLFVLSLTITAISILSFFRRT